MGNTYSGIEQNFWPNIPRNILKTNWREVLDDVWTRKGALHGFAWNESNSFSGDIYYEDWMTMDEWADSEYNIDGWTWAVFGETNGALVSADGQWYMLQYYIKDANGESHRCTMGECMEETSFYVASKAEVAELLEKLKLCRPKPTIKANDNSIQKRTRSSDLVLFVCAYGLGRLPG